MVKKLLTAAAVFLISAAMLLFSGCARVFSDPLSLMSPPLVGENLVAIENVLGRIAPDFTLAYPADGYNRNAIIFKNIVGTGEGEDAIVFYQTTVDNATTTNMSVLMQDGGEWRSVFDTTLPGIGVDRVDFVDIMGDERYELLVGSNMVGANERQLNIYRYDDGEFTLVSQETYTRYIICDIGASEKPQILYFNIITQAVPQTGDDARGAMEQVVTARLVSFSYEMDGVATSLGTVRFDRNITAFSNIVQSPISEDKNVVFVDAYLGARGMITEVFYYDGALTSIFYNPLEEVTADTLREALINSRDVDGDGMVEVPRSHLCLGYDDTTTPGERMYFTEWFNLYGARGLGELVATGFLSVTDRFFLNIPRNWIGTVTVRRDPYERTHIFYEWDFNNDEAGEELFRIRVFAQRDFEFGGEYTQIAANDDQIIAAAVNGENQSEYSMTYRQLERELKLLG